MPPKTNINQKNAAGKENQDQLVLIRDETSQLLMLASATKAIPVKKGDQLVLGNVVSWQDNNRQRWRGPILAVGTQAHCEKIMSTIEKNSMIKNTESTSSKKKEETKLASTITIETDQPEQVLINEKSGDGTAQDSVIDDELDRALQDDVDDDARSDVLQSDAVGNEVEEEQLEEEDSSSVRPKENASASEASRAEKRSIQENTTVSTKKRKTISSSLTVPYSTYSKKEQECLALEGQIAYYRQSWMPRPVEPSVIRYLIEITDILRGVHKDDDEEEDEETIFEEIKKTLDMDEQQLSKCHRKTATATARRIMKHIFPSPTAEDKKILKDELFIKAVIRYTRISNPSDPTADVDIRHAIGNYFAAYEYKNRRTAN